MLRGIYTAASGMISNMVSNDNLANNLANISTAGFKKNNISFQSFPDLLLNRISKNDSQPIGKLSTGSKVYETRTDFNQGAIYQTGNQTDLAIQGDGFFTVKDSQGNIGYTRNGAFTINNEGFLMTFDGRYVQGEKGNIQLPAPVTGKIESNRNGDIAMNGNIVDRLKITQFEENHTLLKVGNNLYTPSAKTQQASKPKNYTIAQGAVEHSNVNPLNELVNSITGMRLYEALQKNISIQNQVLGRTVNDVGARPR